MRHIVGSAVKIRSEIDADFVADTTITLVSITNPNGVTTTLNSAMTYAVDGDATNIASVVYQTSDDDVLGRYKYLVKTLNGTRKNYENGLFILEAQV